MTKAAMRVRAKARLAALSAAHRQDASLRIAERIWTLDEVSSARVILLYASMRSEVETDTMAMEALRRGITVAFPRCLQETRAMVLHAVRSLGELRTTGPFGIREPDPAGPMVSVGDVDVAVVPGLAWDRSGGRLGRGQGYYDRLLTSRHWAGLRCGVFFAEQEVERVPVTPLDSPLDAVVTQDAVIRVGRSN